MKFYNKRKEVRLRCWTCVKLHLKDHHPFLSGNYQGFLRYSDYDKLKVELQNNSSKGKFWMCLIKREIWFADSKDATWFSLVYSEMLR